ncbi:unnamed protein product [Effrenium voratum]|nr:unnamed protein product [Effrenium voratum]
MGRLTRPDIVTMNSAISACAKSSKWIKAIQLLDVSKHVQQGPDMFTYGAAIRACEGNWRVAVQLLDEMQEGKLQPNEVISASTVRACSRGNPEASIQLFESLKRKGIRQNKFSYTAALSACHVDQYLWSWSLWCLQEMKADGIEIDIGALNAVMGACQSAHYWGRLQKQDSQLVERVFEDVRYLQLAPDVITYSHAMAAAKEAGSWQRALELLNEAHADQLQPDSALYTHAISACASGSSWENALQLLAAAAALGPVTYHYSSAMAACAEATQWEQAVALVPEMAEASLEPEVVTYTALISAYLNGGHWPMALQLLSEMQRKDSQPNHITFTSGVKACMPSQNFAFAVRWKQEMERLGVQPYFTTYVYLVSLAAEVREWKWVEYFLAEVTVRYPNAENFDNRQAGELLTLDGTNDFSSSTNHWHAEISYDEKVRRHEASLTLAQRMGLVAPPAQPLTSEQWEQVKQASDQREDSTVPCSICLDDFRTRPQVILSCSHVFHGECLGSFERFAGKRHCPLCRCPYFDATIHHTGLMVWRKKCAGRIQKAWRGYKSRDELYSQLRQPDVRLGAPCMHRRFCGKALQALGGKLEKACEEHEDSLERFLQELDGSVAESSAALREGLCSFERLHATPMSSAGVHAASASSQEGQSSHPKSQSLPSKAEGEPSEWAAARRAVLSKVDCPICFQLCDLSSQGNRVELLSCSHVFHRTCLVSFESFHVFEVGPVCRQTYERRPWNLEARGEARPRPPRPGRGRDGRDGRGRQAAQRPNYRILHA